MFFSSPLYLTYFRLGYICPERLFKFLIFMWCVHEYISSKNINLNNLKSVIEKVEGFLKKCFTFKNKLNSYYIIQ